MDAIVIVALVIAFAVCVLPGALAWHKAAEIEAMAARQQPRTRKPRMRTRKAF